MNLPRGIGIYCALAASLGAQSKVNPDHVTFYSEPNFKGSALTVEAGATVENLDRLQHDGPQPWSYAISSVQVFGAARAIVYSAPGFQGDRLEIGRNIDDLYAAARGAAATWDRAIASVSVVSPPPPPRYPEPPATVVVVPPPAPAPPPPVVIREVRPMISPREADALVVLAFRDVLNRNPDAAGLRTYRDRIMREGWSERQVVESLQRSAEARGINPEQAIARLYREVLGRDPDPAGLAHYRQLWRDGWTQGQIREDLRRSAEAHDRRP